MENDSSEEEEETEEEPVKKPRGPYLHYLDWLRSAMIICVVFAHVARMGFPPSQGGLNGEIKVDDRNYIGEMDIEKATPLGVRWISIVRQWCVPLLFWVSGASDASSFQGSFPMRKMRVLFVYTALGMLMNAAIWFLGPNNEMCDPAAKCPGKGILFDFTVSPWCGKIFPIVFQMWYTLGLMLLTLLNHGLLMGVAGLKICGMPPVCGLVIQFVVTSSIYIVLVFFAGSLTPYKATLIPILLFYEAVFLTIAYFSSRSMRPRWMPLRVLHYMAGICLALQMGATSLADGIVGMEPTFGLYIFVGFNKFYALGYLMLFPRRYSKEDDVQPLLSRIWPVVLLGFSLLAPSTNWYLAGNLTYPYYPRMSDRIMYIMGAVVVMFVIDRVGRFADSVPMPFVLDQMCFLLYLFHPTFMTVAVALGVDMVSNIFYYSLALGLAMAVVKVALTYGFQAAFVMVKTPGLQGVLQPAKPTDE